MSDRAEQLRRRLLATFQVEASEHLAQVSSELDAIADGPAAPEVAGRLQSLFRVVHTLKGAARSVGLTAVEQLSHRTESLLRDLTRDRRSFDLDVLGTLRQASDGLSGLVAGSLSEARLAEILSAIDGLSPGPAVTAAGAAASVEPALVAAPATAVSGEPPKVAGTKPEIVGGAGAPTAPTLTGSAAAQGRMASNCAAPASSAPPTGSAQPAPAASDSIRIEVGRLDRMLLIAEELLVPKLAARERARSARGLLGSLGELRSRLRAGRRLNGRNGDDIAELVAVEAGLRAIEAEARRLSTALADDYTALRITVDSLFDETRRARMRAAGTMLEAFPRMIRDLARETGKELTWRSTGEELEVDRRILDAIKDPVIHLVRNAVDHGIELPAAREAAGKPRQGEISITIQPLDGGRIAIEVADDGKGFDLLALGQAAVRSRLLKAGQAETLEEGGLAELAFHTGVSTSPVITNISGNGLGLAIVRERIERVDGQVTVRSRPGAGTVFRMELPVTIATSRGLILRTGGHTYAWPVDSLEAVTGVARSEFKARLELGLIPHGGETLPLGHLGFVLGHAAGNETDQRRLAPCLIVRAGGRRAALLVDEVLGESEILVKELRPPLRRVRHVAMAGLLGTGELILVLRPADVLAAIHAGEGTVGQEQTPVLRRARRLLVVDDSLTTRSMERNLFESAGYSVRVAADGVDAWTALQAEEIDLVVSDIDMPRMNGFDLTSRIRGDARLADLPVVLVTALDAREDKERGIQVGANAYVLKSTFDQSNLLEIVGRLI